VAEPQPGFVANEGDPNQLPRGEALTLNENTNVEAPEPLDIADQPTEEAPPAEAAPESGPLEGEDDLGPAGAADFDPLFQPMTDEEEFLTGPTTRPDEAQFVGSGVQRGLPPTVRRRLAQLQEAASDPEASPELRALVAYLIRSA
jgi:hypothetical protein